MAKFKVLAIALNMQYIIVRTKKQKQLHSNTGETASKIARSQVKVNSILIKI